MLQANLLRQNFFRPLKEVWHWPDIFAALVDGSNNGQMQESEVLATQRDVGSPEYQ